MFMVTVIKFLTCNLKYTNITFPTGCNIWAIGFKKFLLPNGPFNELKLEIINVKHTYTYSITHNALILVIQYNLRSLNERNNETI